LRGTPRTDHFDDSLFLAFSHISGITLLGVPADVYKYGGAYWLCIPALIIVGIVSNLVYLPVLFEAQITSVYEYLEKRFDQRARTFSSLLFALSQVLFLPIVIYIPALAFAAGTSLDTPFRLLTSSFQLLVSIFT
jgi:sodium-coupled monocarboxylate transporter 8/12